ITQVQSALPPVADMPPLAEPGQWVRIKELSPTCTEPKWSPSHQVLLSTLMAVKVEGVKTWLHASRINHGPEPPEQWQVQQLERLKLKLQRSPALPADLFS
uniref:Murine leukemia virus integrase C-terminal domain-containing protein n=1 Tax=Pseudonaja textilis TaxID=8673 RepID=A0A670Z435_PSETE